MGYAFALSGPETRALFDLPAPPQGPGLPAAPARPGRFTSAGARRLMWFGRARWLLMAPLAEEPALAAALAPAGAELWSDALCFFRLTGPDAGVALAVACPLDLHPRAFGPDAVAWSDAFGTRALVLREDEGWALGVEPSYGDYIAHHLQALG